MRRIVRVKLGTPGVYLRPVNDVGEYRVVTERPRPIEENARFEGLLPFAVREGEKIVVEVPRAAIAFLCVSKETVEPGRAVKLFVVASDQLTPEPLVIAEGEYEVVALWERGRLLQTRSLVGSTAWWERYYELFGAPETVAVAARRRA